MVRLVLFDIDGTLIQSGGAGEKAFARVFANEFNVSNGTAVEANFTLALGPARARPAVRGSRKEP